MDTTIGYLHELREDLLDAAWRQALPEAGRRWRPRWRPTRRALAAAISMLVLVSAGLTGWAITRPNGTTRALAPTPIAGEPSFAAVQPGAVRQRLPAFIGASQPTHPADVPFTVNGQVNSIAPGDLSRIVKTASLTVIVARGTFAQRFQATMDVAARFGGYVQTSSTFGRRAGSLVMRIPAARFTPALDALRRLGTVDRQTVTGEDVTSQYIDLQARLRIAEARREVLFGLMAKATTIEQTIRVQNALDDVQLRIEQIEGDLNVLNNQTSKATIRFSMHEEGVGAASANVRNPSIPNAWDRAIAGFFGVVAAVVVGLGYVLPIGVLLIVLALVALGVRRRLAA
jgi:hypothetical protein